MPSATPLSKSAKSSKEVTSHRNAFVKAYVANGGKAGWAYREAFNCSKECADKNAWAYSKRPDVKEQISTEWDAHFAKNQITEDRIIRELTNIAFSDIGDLYSKDGELLPVHKIPENARRSLKAVESVEKTCISGDDLFAEVETEVVTTKKVTASDKLKALELFVRIKGMIIDQKVIALEGNMSSLLGEIAEEDANGKA